MNINEMSDKEKRDKLEEVRKEIKKAEGEYNRYKSLQLALKMVINGTYGAFAHPKFVVSNKHIANAITMHGRDVILYMLEKIENYFYNEWHLDKEIHELLKYTYIGIDEDYKAYMLDKNNKILHYPSQYSKEYEEKSENEKEKSALFNLLKSWNINPEKLEKIENKKININGKNIVIKWKRHLHDFKTVKPIDGTVTGDRELMDNYDTKFHKEDMIIYGDTDSLYLTYTPIMNSVNYNGDGLEFILTLDRIFVKDMFEKQLNEYAEKYKVKNIHDFELETVNSSSLHLQKKMYINNVLWEDGIFFNNMEHFIPKGIDIVRSSTPPFVRGRKQKGGIWEFINYIFKEADNLNSADILKILKDLKSQFILENIENISFTTSLSNYESKVIDDQNTVSCVTGAHFSVKAGALHNYLLNKYSDYKSKYDLLKGGRVKWYFIKNYPLNDRFAYLRSFHPYEIVEKEKIEIDYDRQFKEAMLSIVNKFVKPIGLPEINKRLGVLNSIFDGENIGNVIKERRNNSGDTFSELDEWDSEFDF